MTSLETQAASSAKTILVVEDEALIAMLIEGSLLDEGYRVFVAANAIEAIKMLERYHVDGLVTDIRMPGNGDGWTVGERARELQPDLPVIYVTGDSMSDWKTKGVPESVLLSKPMATSMLVSVMGDLVYQAPAAAQIAS